jgi:hypothetical protein
MERRVVVSLNDIAGVRWTCPFCDGTVIFNPRSAVRIPDALCPLCGKRLLDKEPHRRGLTLAIAFVDVLQRASDSADPPQQFLELEFIEKS